MQYTYTNCDLTKEAKAFYKKDLDKCVLFLTCRKCLNIVKKQQKELEEEKDLVGLIENSY